MMHDYWPSYVKEGFIKGFKKHKPYYISYIDQEDNFKTLKVFIESVYSERIPRPIINGVDNRTWLVKLYLPKKYKSKLHKFLRFGIHTYKLFDDYINILFVKDTILESEIAFLQLLSHPGNVNSPSFIRANALFADKHPDIYINKIMSYKGLSTTYSPLLKVDFI